MVSSTLPCSLFTDLPRELRNKIYREVFADSKFSLHLTSKGAGAAITHYQSPEDISFLLVSSQIYKEALPELAFVSELWLELTKLTAGNGYDIIDLFSNNFTPNLLKRCMPLIKTVICMPRDLNKTIITGFTEFAALELLHLRAWCLHDYELGMDFSDLQKKDFVSPIWEGRIMSNVQGLLDQDFAPLASIFREATGRFQIIEVEMCGMVILQRELKVLAKDDQALEESEGYRLSFDTADALAKGIQALNQTSI